MATVSVTWSNLDTGAHPMYVQANPTGVISETNTANNMAAGAALIATQQVLLPLVGRNAAGGP